MPRKKKQSEIDKRFVEAARMLYHRDGEIEVDDGAVVSHGDDDGAYVQAWVWVTDDDVEQCVSADTVDKRLKLRRT